MLRPRQLLVVGGMLFSMFFGAGNLILPPLLGLQAGIDAPVAMVGFLVAGIGLPVLGIVAVALCGDVRQLAGRVSPLLHQSLLHWCILLSDHSLLFRVRRQRRLKCCDHWFHCQIIQT